MPPVAGRVGAMSRDADVTKGLTSRSFAKLSLDAAPPASRRGLRLGFL